MPNKGGKRKEEKQRFCSVPKTLSQQPESGYLFSCLITCLHGYKIGHEKRINKVLFPWCAPVWITGIPRRAQLLIFKLEKNMYCPALEYEITQNKKRSEKARELSRVGYCYIEVEDKLGKYYITDIMRMGLGEYQSKKLSISKSKKYKTVNGFWSDIRKKTLEQYEDDKEMDDPDIMTI